MRKILIIAVLWGLVISLQGQVLREEIRNNTRCSASNYMAYPGPVQQRLSPAPEGKQPFYISHYGRHGSRYHNKQHTYDTPYYILAKADSLGKLTALGRDVMHRLDIIRRDAEHRWGELTELGALQHQQIMQRMVDRFPEVFADGVDIDARSTTVMRCILSMENAMVQLSRMKPKVDIHHNATQRDMWYLNQQDRELFALKMDSATKAQYDAFAQQYERNDRLMLSLFNDTAYIRQHVDAGKLNYYLFKVASNLQSTHMRNNITLYDIFTDNEIYHNWKKENAWWYTAFGGCTINGGLQPYTQRNLLRKIIAQADSCLRLPHPSVHLRYGHETIIMPLTCLLDLNGYGMATDNLETVDRRGWANYKIFPMGANIQFIFYRSGVDDEDILFKVLLNENEASLPLRGDMAPYYHWNDFREYYLQKLDGFEEKKAKYLNKSKNK